MTYWTLEVLDTHLLTCGATSFTPERKMVGVLLYLALEGRTSRQKLAGLLWPEVPEVKARNSLAQVLRRLRVATYPEIITGDALLAIDAAVEVDVRHLKLLAFRGDAAGVLEHSADLLPHLEFDDCPEFSDWLFSEREAVRTLVASALQVRIEALEKQALYPDALPLAERLIALDPLLEAPYRLAMRMHYLAGARTEALRVYATCKAVLARDLGLEPVAETQTLAKMIEQGQLDMPPSVPRQLPVALLRPPRLIGREEAWAQMEEAWEAGRFIFIFGPPGVGKTRLATEFAASKGRILHFTGRPGDQMVPYSAHARAFRLVLRERPDLVLAPWVRDELSRILPELLGEHTPALLSGETNKLRFYDAQGEILRLGSQGIDAWVIDDLQYYDLPSMEVGNYLAAKFAPLGQPGGMPRFIDVCRSGEMAPDFEAMVRQAEAVGLATIIDLEPLTVEATEGLIRSLGLAELSGAGLEPLIQSLSRYAGGNPLYTLETLRHLLETGRLAHALPERLVPPERTRTVIRRRLERLSPAAQRVMQAAAILQSDITPTLVGELLEIDRPHLLAAWEELEAAGVFRDDRFSHDLIYETVETMISHPVRTLLNEQAAYALARHDGNSARIVKHWRAAGNHRELLGWLLKAAKQATATYRLGEATDFYQQAKQIAQSLGDHEAVFDAVAGELSLAVSAALRDQIPQLIAELQMIATTDVQRDRAERLVGEYLQSAPSFFAN